MRCGPGALGSRLAAAAGQRCTAGALSQAAGCMSTRSLVLSTGESTLQLSLIHLAHTDVCFTGAPAQTSAWLRSCVGLRLVWRFLCKGAPLWISIFSMWSAAPDLKSTASPSAACLLRAYEIEKGFVRETPLTYVVALSGNTAKDVTQRYTAFPRNPALLSGLPTAHDVGQSFAQCHALHAPFLCDFQDILPSPQGVMQPRKLVVGQPACRYVKSMRPLQKLRDEEWWGVTMAGLRPTLQQSTQPQRRLPSANSFKASAPRPGARVHMKASCATTCRAITTKLLNTCLQTVLRARRICSLSRKRW